MSEAALILPPEAAKLLERASEERSLAPEAVIAELLLRLAGPGERPRILLDTARSLLLHARERGNKGDFRGAFLRLWSAAVLAVEAYAAARGAEPQGFRDYWVLVEELGSGAMNGWYGAVAAFIAWREGVDGKAHVEHIAGLLEELLSAAEKRAHGV